MIFTYKAFFKLTVQRVQVLEPIHSESESITFISVVKDMFLTAAYVLATLALPVLFQFNRIPRFWYAIVTMPILVVSGEGTHVDIVFICDIMMSPTTLINSMIDIDKLIV
jgi:hypothetical protein